MPLSCGICMIAQQKITPFLWFNTQAQDAVEFYLSIFRNAQMGAMMHYDAHGAKVSGMPEGSIMTIEFTLEGQPFIALNGGPAFRFTEAISFVISCDSQEEVDHYWNKLSERGDPAAQQCGWLKDQFGVSWQVVPRMLNTYLTGPGGGRAMQALLKMKKIDIKEIERAYEGLKT